MTIPSNKALKRGNDPIYAPFQVDITCNFMDPLEPLYTAGSMWGSKSYCANRYDQSLIMR